MIYKGWWSAKIEQEFEIEAENEQEFQRLLDEEMSPRNVVELKDFDSQVMEEVPS